jgi:hypothetical protein
VGGGGQGAGGGDTGIFYVMRSAHLCYWAIWHFFSLYLALFFFSNQFFWAPVVIEQYFISFSMHIFLLIWQFCFRFT